ncbi:hypothetical protein BGZ83_004206 [Gryganskiella cystojenkinii]|nr:hypothetical protein BGZ83_004206 [Gryganskiella cystojenkinii]
MSQSSNSNQSAVEEELKRQRASRLAALPDQEKGRVYWDDWCIEAGVDAIPTWETLIRFAEDFALPMAETINKRALQDPTLEPICGLKSAVNGPTQSHGGPAVSRRTPGLSLVNGAISALAARPIPAAITTNINTPPVDNAQIRTSVAVATSSSSSSNNSNRNASSSNHPQIRPILSVANANTSLPMELRAEEFFLLPQGANGRHKGSEITGTHQLSAAVKSVKDVLIEWRYGTAGGPALQDLNRLYFSRWRIHEDHSQYNTRAVIVRHYVDMVQHRGFSDQNAIKALERLRAGRSLWALANVLKKQYAETISARKRHRELEVEAEYGDEGEEEARGEGGHRPEVPGEDRGENVDDRYNGDASRVLVWHKKQAIQVHQPRQRQPRHYHRTSTAFPFPVRDLHSIIDIWTEWTIGWDNQPSIESLIQHHGEVWKDVKFKSKYYSMFYAKSRFVRIVREAVANGAAQTHQDAVNTLETIRESRTPKSFSASPDLRKIMGEWKVERKKRGRY